MKIKTFHLILILVFLYVVSSNSNFVSPIKGLLDHLNIPIRVHALVCWNFYDRLNFVRVFMKPNDEYNVYQLAITNIDMKYLPEIDDEHQYVIVVDLQCYPTKQLLRNANLKLTNRFRWIILDSKSKGDDGDKQIMNTFEALPVLPNSEVFCIYRQHDHDYIIKQVYRTSMGTQVKIELFGLYTNNTLLDYRPIRITAKRRRDLEGLELRATLVITNNDTLNHLTDYHDIHVDTISKVDYFLTNHLVDYVNGKINYKFVNSWGYMDINTSTWSGMIGDLIYNRSDIGASALFFTTDRIEFIEYIAMPTPTRSKFVFRSPKLSYTENVFLLPFDSLVWYSIISLIIITSLALTFSTWTEWKITFSKDEDMNIGILRPSLLDTLILVFGATCQQGSAVQPKSLTARIIMLIAFTILMFLYTSYSASIVALLQSPSNKIQTLEDLLVSRLKLGADDTVFNRYYFTHAIERTRRKIYEQKILNKDSSSNFMSLEKGINKLREGLFAFHMETGVGYKIVSETFLEDEKCSLQEIQYLQVIDPWYAIQKNSSYKELLKVGMMRIHENGLQDRENSKLYTKKPKCSSGAGGKFITASLVDTRPALLIILWGFLLSFVLFLIEYTIFTFIIKKN